MSSKIDRYLGIVCICAILLANTALTFAQGDLESFSLFAGEDSEQEDFELIQRCVDPDNCPATPSTDDSLSNAEKQEIFLNRIKDELNLSKADYRQVLISVNETQEQLRAVTEEKTTLEVYLKNLDKMINSTSLKLFDVVKQLIEVENEISLTYEQIEVRRIALEYQKNLLKDYIRIIYEEENNYFSYDENGEINAFKLLLADGSVGDNLKELKYFDLLNEAGQQMIEELDVLALELKKYEKGLTKKQTRFSLLQKELEDQKERLELQKKSKEKLLELTLGQEKVFSQLLEQTIDQQEELLGDVKALSEAFAFIKTKIAEEGDNFDPDEYISILDKKNKALYSFHFDPLYLESDGFVWPVDPNLGISAYFHDPGYKSTFGFQHNAIDIPEYQGSPVRAADNGVVYTTKDNGYGYSYIILAHANGFMTVYGHISNILVDEGDTVPQGAVIGLSGGMPGTIGAGYITTGPHLHFELLLNGLYVDPLDHLPIEILTEDQINTLPEKYYSQWEVAVAKANFEAISRF